MELKRHFALALLVSALTATAVPAWCAAQVAVVETPRIVNVNTADAATLAAVLQGVGDAKAEAIVAYRKAHGPFTSLEQLAEVKGIGAALVAKNRAHLAIK
jgi:competence protein ComEA